MEQRTSEMFETLKWIAKEIDQENIVWAVGGSILLFTYGIVDVANDIDLIVREEDAEKLHSVLLKLGSPEKRVDLDPFRTIHFSKFRVNKQYIDVMGGFAIAHEAGVYQMPFNEESVFEYYKVNGYKIPFCSLEDWYIMYSLMPEKEGKAQCIKEYMKKNGVQHPDIFLEAYKKPLPDNLIKSIKHLLERSTKTD